MSPKTIETLPGLLRVSAERFGSRLAVASREGLRTRALTYRALADAAESVAADLVVRCGLRPGDRVILLTPSGVRATATLFGLFRAGLIAVPLDLHSAPAFVEAVRQKTEAAAIVSGDSLPIPPGLKEIPLGSVNLDGPRPANLPEPGPGDVAEIVFTSGTTGAPKGVALTHGNIVSDLVAGSRVVPERETMNLLSILPLSHMFEQLVGLFLPILKGGSVHFSPSLRPSAIMAEMARRRVTGMAVVPRFLGLLMSAAEEQMSERGLGRVWHLQHRVARALPMSLRRIVFLPLHRRLGGRLRFFVCGGARLPPDLMRAWERTGVRIIEGYGATECSPVIASNNFNDRVPGSVGHTLEGVDVRVSEEGELQVRGPNVFRGYWQDAERTAAAFTADGWYRTDDIAEFGPDGSLRIAGRLSDRIVLASGMNVYPEDVEAALAVQPGVKECVVLGLSEHTGGERVYALVRPAEGADETQVGRSVELANASLASHQRITGFTLWSEEFPKTLLQKVKRAALRAAMEGRIPSSAEPAVDSVGQAAHLLRRVLRIGPTAITPSTRLEAGLGLDSLGRMELVALIERETGRDVPEEVIAGLATAGELAVLLASPGPAATPMRFPRWPRGRPARSLRPLLQPWLLFLPHRIFARPYSVLGQEALAGIEGPCLIIANHASHADTVSILRALPIGLRARTAVAAAADYFFAHSWTGSLVGLVVNAFAFSREGRVRQSLDHCGLLADEGWSILIYPEGTRSPDGRLLPFKGGIGLLATGLGVPVVPVSVTGGARLLPKGARWPRRAAVSVCFGPPVTIPPGMRPDEATELLQRAVAVGLPRELLSGREGSFDGR